MNPATAGLVAGTTHHFTVQYPNQSSLVTTIYAFSLINTIYFVLLLLEYKDAILLLAIGGLIKGLLIFNFVYVESPENDSNSISFYPQSF